eukprot:jgi/Psemu1/301690/fgenesh1_kg.42_\
MPAAVPKKSYSPFGGGKPKSVGNDSLYSPPVNRNPSFEDTEPEMSSSDTWSSTSLQEQYSNIADSDPLTSNVPVPFSKSYSPFGGTKPRAATSDPLYRPPTPPTSSEGGDDYYVQGSEPSIASPDSTSFSAEAVPPPKNFSPFGGAKPFASYDDSLYSPPSYDSANTDETSPVPEVDTFETPPVKKSYSPFGSKPKAPSDSGSNGGGYLGGL